MGERVIIAGSRTLRGRHVLRAIMRSGIAIDVVLSGDARGVDQAAARFAERAGIPVELYPADWAQGRGAGKARNAEMARNGTALVAVWDGASPGTAHMIGEARAAGLRMHVEVFE